MNVVDYRTYCQLANKPGLNRSSVKFFRYGSSKPLDIIGEFFTRLKYRGNNFHVVFQVSGNVQGNKMLHKMGIIRLIA